MIKLNLPKYKFSIRRHGNKHEIFDSIRNKYVALTSEEWVRQNFIAYLIKQKTYPASLLAVEKTFILYRNNVRPDIVSFDNRGKPRVIVECKAPEIKISQQSFDQIVKYNFALKADYLIITNGISHFCCKIDFENKTYKFLKTIPPYKSI